MRRSIGFLAYLIVTCYWNVAVTSAFVVPSTTQTVRVARTNHDRRPLCHDEILVRKPSPPLTRSSLEASPVTIPLTVIKNGISNVSPTTRAAVLLGSAVVAALYSNRRKSLYSTDPHVSAPLPEGKYGGCPLFGSNVLFKDKKSGMSTFFAKASAKLGNPRIWKCLAFGKPMAVVSGSDNIRAVLGSEFKSPGVRTGSGLKSTQMIFGDKSLLFSQSEKEHNYLRRLVGQAMTPEAISRAIPTLQRAVLDQVDKLLLASNDDENNPVVMEKVCTEFTLDVAWRLILGLDLNDEEIPVFRTKVNEWIVGSFSPRVIFLPFTKQSRGYKARLYLVDKIERKIKDLKKNGPDGSTLSAMVFAQDEESQQRLTQMEIIDNALLLIIAGSETAASTLTNAMLFLGLHPDIYQKVIDEQRDIISRNGEDITRTILDKECPYLEAVIKETMRIRPLAGGGMRIATETMVVDGKQIPKGWPIQANIQLTHELDPVVVAYKDDDGSHMDVRKGFCPERWLDPSTRPSADWIPFGWGPRFCLGANLAMVEMKLFLATFARKVASFQLVNDKDDFKWRMLSIIPKPEDGTVITVVDGGSPVQRKATAVGELR